MLDVKKTTGTAAIDDFVERVVLGGVEARIEGHVLGREIVGSHAVAPSFVSDIFIGGTPYFGRRRRRRIVVSGGRGGALHNGRGAVFGYSVRVGGIGLWVERGERGVEQ